jgi:hypothetical protein
MKKIILAIIVCHISLYSLAQKLKPGFDINEYKECLCMASHFKELPGIDSMYFSPKPTTFTKRWISPVVGFDNQWELWENRDSILAISIRGSVTTPVSWMGNFHAGMVASNGKYTLGKEYDYSLCNNTDASVHAGWLGGMLSLSESILNKIDSCHALGYRDFILTGHSQGGAITYLLTAYLRELQNTQKIPSDITFKTYCSAAPKPGDYAFACMYEYMTRGGWAYNVVNADDWVPETPLSVQTINDFRKTNPFNRIDQLTDTLRFADKFKIKFLFNTLGKPGFKTEDKLQKYLGNVLGSMLKDLKPEYVIPSFRDCANYARCGHTIILMPDKEYHQKHPKDAKDMFEHHMFLAYWELANKYNE